MKATLVVLLAVVALLCLIEATRVPRVSTHKKSIHHMRKGLGAFQKQSITTATLLSEQTTFPYKYKVGDQGMITVSGMFLNNQDKCKRVCLDLSDYRGQILKESAFSVAVLTECRCYFQGYFVDNLFYIRSKDDR